MGNRPQFVTDHYVGQDNTFNIGFYTSTDGQQWITFYAYGLSHRTISATLNVMTLVEQFQESRVILFRDESDMVSFIQDFDVDSWTITIATKGDGGVNMTVNADVMGTILNRLGEAVRGF